MRDKIVGDLSRTFYATVKKAMVDEASAFNNEFKTCLQKDLTAATLVLNYFGIQPPFPEFIRFIDTISDGIKEAQPYFKYVTDDDMIFTNYWKAFGNLNNSVTNLFNQAAIEYQSVNSDCQTVLLRNVTFLSNLVNKNVSNVLNGIMKSGLARDSGAKRAEMKQNCTNFYNTIYKCSYIINTDAAYQCISQELQQNGAAMTEFFEDFRYFVDDIYGRYYRNLNENGQFANYYFNADFAKYFNASLCTSK